MTEKQSFSPKQKKEMLSLAVSTIGLVAGIWLHHQHILPHYAELGYFLALYLFTGGGVLLVAFKQLFQKQLFDEHILMSVATLGAFALGEYPEAVAVMLFYRVGEFFQDLAVDHSRRSIAALMDIRAPYANVEENGSLVQKDPEDVEVGTMIVVRPGERVPLDGSVVEGESYLDTASLTGESAPRFVKLGNNVLSGSINQTVPLRLKVEKVYEDSTVARILDLVENAAMQKAPTERFITRFARIYTPLVVAAAVLLAIVPPLVLHTGFAEWIHRALLFLVISCPCALVLSVPLGFFAGMGGASRRGVLIKGGTHMEVLADTKTVVFDKTGTLTTGNFAVSDVQAMNGDIAYVSDVAAAAERYSTHPLAQSLQRALQAAGRPFPASSEVEETAGNGVTARVNGRKVMAGKRNWLAQSGITVPENASAAAQIHLAEEGKYMGSISFEDELKAGATKAVTQLRNLGVAAIAMFSGDNRAAVQRTAEKAGIDQVYAELLPQNKVEKLQELLNKRGPKEKIAFVGDGVNDAPVLALADVGIAMGGVGSDAAVEAADVVLMDDDPMKVPMAVRISRATLGIVRQNIWFALLIKFGVMILGALGYANMWMAVFADVGVAVIAVFNSLRAMRVE